MPISRDAFIGPGFVRQLAAVYAAVGERNAALEQLESLILPGSRYYNLLLDDPVWDPIRDDPRFRALANN
jgi:serine/threonine-protein kinase